MCIARSTHADCCAAVDRSTLVADGTVAEAGAEARAAPISAEAPSAAMRPRRGVDDMGTFLRGETHATCA